MKREIIITRDGSHSISNAEMGVTYHSHHGALQESVHVFIESGLRFITKNHSQVVALSVFEMGFGTGLNALLTLIEAENKRQPICYETVELFPLEAATIAALNYCELLLRPGLEPVFRQLHSCAWDTLIKMTPFFSFKKRQTSLVNFSATQSFNLVYFDAFAPDIQPDLWTAAIFRKLYDCMEPGAVLTTYCSKSIVRKAMGEAGFTVEKIPGPPHKREMVRAVKR